MREACIILIFRKLRKKFVSDKSGIDKEITEVTFVGQRVYDNLKSPRPDITHPIHYGEEFLVVEEINLDKIQKLQALNMWVMAKRKAFPNDMPKKVPLSYLAVKKSLDSYSWFFGKIDRVEAVSILERDAYPVGTRVAIKYINRNLDLIMTLHRNFHNKRRTGHLCRS